MDPVSGMQSMDIESTDAIGRKNYILNHIRGSKKYIAIGAVLILALVSIPLIATSNNKKGTTTNSSSSSSSSSGDLLSSGSMSWPPPIVNTWEDGIQTNRGRMLLRDGTNSNGITSGVTIMQKMDLTTDNQIHVATGDVLTDLDMRLDDNQIVATDLENGGKRIEFTVNHIQMDVTSSMNGQTLVDTHYDSSSNTDGAGLDPAFDALKDLIGHATVIEVDEHGKVLLASDHESLYKAMNSSGGDAQTAADTMKQFSSENQFNQLNRMAKALPKDELVSPGDKWDFEMQMDTFFRGSAVLLGYKEYDHSDCAVIQLDGTIHFDSDQLHEMADAMSEHMDQPNKEQYNQLMGGAEIKDGKMNAILYWDHEHQVERYSKTVVSMTMIMSNPLDPSAKMKVPTEETMIIYSSIV